MVVAVEALVEQVVREIRQTQRQTKENLVAMDIMRQAPTVVVAVVEQVK